MDETREPFHRRLHENRNSISAASVRSAQRYPRAVPRPCAFQNSSRSSTRTRTRNWVYSRTWRRRVCRPVTSILSTRSCRCRDPFRNIITMCRTCRSHLNPHRCPLRRVLRPRNLAATSRSIPTARTVSLALTRPRTRRTTSPRRASDYRSWKPETSPERLWIHVALCWCFRTPGFPCRCRKELFPNRSGRNSI